MRTNGGGAFNTLSPRQALTPAPYAIFATTASNLSGTLPAGQLTGGIPAAQLTGTIPSAQLGGTYSNPVSFNNGADSFNGTFIGQFLGGSFIGGSFNGNFFGNGGGIIGVNAANSALLNGLSSTNFWLTAGNAGTTPGANFLGTTDNQSLIIKVNGQEAVRYEPTTDTPNIVGGFSGNTVQAGLEGVTIGGGGTVLGNQPNLITNNGHYATIAGGYHNTVTNYGGAILGGSVNFAGGTFGVIGGGQFNTIRGDDSIIGGGLYNTNKGTESFIGGGHANSIEVNGNYSTIAGGYGNSILSNAYDSVIAGGIVNTNQSILSVIGGGQINSIQASAPYSLIGGGYGNTIVGDAHTIGFYGSDNSTIGGGLYNSIQTNSPWSLISGGYLNQIQPYALASTIGGGYNNIIQGNSNFWFGFTLFSSTIGGGAANQIQTNAAYSTIAGGLENVIQTNSSWSTIPGGSYNTIQPNDYHAVIGGGAYNTIQTNAHDSVIAGGYQNTIQTNSVNGVIGGGYLNAINASASFSTIGGGTSNTIGSNVLNATIPGGYANTVGGNYSFAAGLFAQAANDGTFVWADSQGPPFSSTVSNTFLIRAQNGVGINTNNPQSALHVNGYVTASGFSGIGSGLTGLSAGQLTGFLPSTSFAGTYSSAVSLNNAANSFSGNGASLTSVNAATLGGLAPSSFWKTTGNAGTTPGLNFIGTTDNQALLIRGSFVGVGRSTAITGSDYFGVDAPVSSLGAYGGMYMNTTGSGAQPFYGYSQAGAGTAFHYVDGADGNKWKLNVGGDRLTVTPAGNVGIGNTGPTALLMVVNARCDGSTWINASDRNLKENFSAVDSREILEKVVSLPVSEWTYKSDTHSFHLGPVAQDFYKQFKLGADDRSIATVDEGGVALAAIQGLNQKLEEARAENAALKQRLERLEQLIDRKIGGGK